MTRDDDMHSEAHAAPAHREGAAPREDAFTPLRDALAWVGAELGLPELSAFDALAARWSDIVGADIAAHAHLDSVRDGVATVTADGPIWATQLRYLETAIVDGAAAVAGPGVVTSVRVRVGG
ncbi:MAG: DUF721 domain-containing protein [Acidimicrobiia bacterium]